MEDSRLVIQTKGTCVNRNNLWFYVNAVLSLSLGAILSCQSCYLLQVLKNSCIVQRVDAVVLLQDWINLAYGYGAESAVDRVEAECLILLSCE